MKLPPHQWPEYLTETRKGRKGITGELSPIWIPSWPGCAGTEVLSLSLCVYHKLHTAHTLHCNSFSTTLQGQCIKSWCLQVPRVWCSLPYLISQLTLTSRIIPLFPTSFGCWYAFTNIYPSNLTLWTQISLSIVIPTALLWSTMALALWWLPL